MADMSTIYNNGNVETTTQSQAVPGVNNDNEFFRQMAMSALTPRPRPRGPVVQSPGPGREAGRSAGHAATPAMQTPARWGMDPMQAIALKEAKEQNAHNQMLRNFERDGPRKKNVVGWGPMTGGFIEDRESIPYSMRGAIGFANSPGDASRDELMRQGGNNTAFNKFAGDQQANFNQYAAPNAAAALSGSTGGGAGGRPMTGSGTDFQQGGLSQRNNYNPQRRK